LLAAALFVLACMPWNIALWWQLRRLRRAIEVDCDARVLKDGHTAADYGEVLLEVGQRQSVLIGAVAAMSERVSFLEQRIRIMTSAPARRRRLSAATLAALSLIMVALAVQVAPPNAVSAAPQVNASFVDASGSACRRMTEQIGLESRRREPLAACEGRFGAPIMPPNLAAP
jgi:beta-lactamase regulating signal transducer with metallopeptidase domain